MNNDEKFEYLDKKFSILIKMLKEKDNLPDPENYPYLFDNDYILALGMYEDFRNTRRLNKDNLLKLNELYIKTKYSLDHKTKMSNESHNDYILYYSKKMKSSNSSKSEIILYLMNYIINDDDTMITNKHAVELYNNL